MAHLIASLPQEIELGAIRRLDYGTETVTTDGGYEVRNNRWAAPLRVYEINYPPAHRDDPIYLAILNLYAEACGGLHSFDYREWVDETEATVVPVRFDSALEITGLTPDIDKIDGIILREVRL